MNHLPTPDSDDALDPEKSLAGSDAALARVTEDLIDILINRGVIQFTDFPPPAQAKLLQRRHTRETLSNRLKLLDDGEHDLI